MAVSGVPPKLKRIRSRWEVVESLRSPHGCHDQDEEVCGEVVLLGVVKELQEEVLQQHASAERPGRGGGGGRGPERPRSSVR